MQLLKKIGFVGKYLRTNGPKDRKDPLSHEGTFLLYAYSFFVPNLKKELSKPFFLCSFDCNV